MQMKLSPRSTKQKVCSGFPPRFPDLDIGHQGILGSFFWFFFSGQMHLWNPDEPSTTRGCVSAALEEERLQEACEELAISWQGRAGHTELLALCDYLGLEVSKEIARAKPGGVRQGDDLIFLTNAFPLVS